MNPEEKAACKAAMEARKAQAKADAAAMRARMERRGKPTEDQIRKAAQRMAGEVWGK